jgi:hypothetical protein
MVKVTRRGYYIIFVIELVLLAVPAVLSVLMFRQPQPPKLSGFARLLELLPAIVIIAAIWLVLEAVIVLRRFRREEAKQRG